MAEARYFTTSGPKRGPILWRDHYDAIGVYEFPSTDTEHVSMPIGMALGDRWDYQRRQLYRLTLKKGGDLPGVWLVVDREFVPAQ
jgi:hypothetical protein